MRLQKEVSVGEGAVRFEHRTSARPRAIVQLFFLLVIEAGFQWVWWAPQVWPKDSAVLWWALVVSGGAGALVILLRILPALVSGGSWGCVLTAEVLMWWQPNGFFGRNMAVEVEDIKKMWTVDTGDSDGPPRVVLWVRHRSGEKLRVPRECTGDPGEVMKSLVELRPDLGG